MTASYPCRVTTVSTDRTSVSTIRSISAVPIARAISVVDPCLEAAATRTRIT
jgi:hypothetical protein